MSKFSNIPTNVISGFLGAGKTTAIKNLLLQKPESEPWAVIVNEFGKVGIDGALLKNDSVEIKEIAGGCLCCVGSQALSVGLNQIIRTIKPQRILIEPTGLGHPQKLIDSLTGEYYQSVLDLKAIINLLDARQLKDSRYTSHQTFIDQIQLADVLIANKADTYADEDRQQLYQYIASMSPAKDKVFFVEQAALKLQWLDYPRRIQRQSKFPEAHQHVQANEDVNDEGISGEGLSGWAMVEGEADGFISIGWAINRQFTFNRQKLLIGLKQICQLYKVERLKGVMQTDTGWISVNMAHDIMSSEEPGDSITNCGEHNASILEMLAYEQIAADLVNKQLIQLLVPS